MTVETVTITVDKKNKATTKRQKVLRNLVFRGHALRNVRELLGPAAETAATAAPPA